MDEKDALEVGNKVHEDFLQYMEGCAGTGKTYKPNPGRIALIGEDTASHLAVMAAIRNAQELGLGVILVGGGHSIGYFSSKSPAIQNIPTEDYLMDIEVREVLRGRKFDMTIFDDLIPNRGSAKTLSHLEAFCGRHGYPLIEHDEIPADKRKGPKGPRGKWGKLK